MKHPNDTTTLELNEAELATIQGGAAEDDNADPTEPGYWIDVRSNALAAHDAAVQLGWQGALTLSPSKIVDAYIMDVNAREQLQAAAENLNRIAQNHEEAREQARDAQEREIAEIDRENQEAEDARLIEEAENLLRETDSYTGGGDGGMPANQESYSGEPNASFPSYMTDGSSGGGGQISTEQVGPDEFPGGSYGGDYNNGQQNQETRLY